MPALSRLTQTRELAAVLATLQRIAERTQIADLQQAAQLIEAHLDLHTPADEQQHQELFALREQLFAGLSRREQLFLRLEADQLDAETIAARLNIQKASVYRYRYELKERLLCATPGELRQYLRHRFPPAAPARPGGAMAGA